MSETYGHVRGLATCICCGGKKDNGLVLCWRCHHDQKRKHEGGYDPRLEDLLFGVEKGLLRANIAHEAWKAATHG